MSTETASTSTSIKSPNTNSSRRHRGRFRRPNRQTKEKKPQEEPKVDQNGLTSSMEKDSQPSSSTAPPDPTLPPVQPRRMRTANVNRPPVQRPRSKNVEKFGPRVAEIRQLESYLKPNFTQTSETTWECKLRPSDPDFAFDIELLEFVLTVPLEYPKRTESLPYVAVKNSDIPKGYTINVERGFASIAKTQLGKGRLLDVLLEFDKRLESFLQQEKGETIKLVKFASTKKKASSNADSNKGFSKITDGHITPSSFSIPHTVFVPNYIKEEVTRQINLFTARLKNDSFIESVSETETVINVKIRPHHSDILPEPLNETFRVLLHVPKNYGIAACQLEIPLSIPEARNIERNFDSHANSSKTWSLLALVNFLTVELDSLILFDDYVKIKDDAAVEDKQQKSKIVEEQAESQPKVKVKEASQSNGPESESESEAETESESEVSDNGSNSGSETNQNEQDNKGEANTLEFTPLKASGTALNFVELELSNVSLLECNSLHLQVECSRCKTRCDMHLVSGPYGRESKAATAVCEKCNNILAAAFRKNLMFTSNANVGYIELAGCKASDYLPSMFFTTCEQCSTTSVENAFKRIELGKRTTATCRECHTRMSVIINGFNFDVINADELAKEKINSKAAKLKARGKEGLKLTGGTPLPNNGACEHYKKSTRWFRFSCCAKVYACDRCHDDQSNHPNERANRMVCGLCSREQNFTDTCHFCGHSFEHKFSPFWEGGKGTRDKVRMSKKDSRKYKRRGS
jgi:uncharacterized CHY-type Zn-finger protein